MCGGVTENILREVKKPTPWLYYIRSPPYVIVPLKEAKVADRGMRTSKGFLILDR